MGRATAKRYEAKTKMKHPSHVEVRTRFVVICGPTRYQLDHGGAPSHSVFTMEKTCAHMTCFMLYLYIDSLVTVIVKVSE